MEIKVQVDGILRVVSGATYDTTCQDVVVALAYAWDRTGRFTLFEKWRHSTRPLAPDEHPLRLLHKWGEYAPEVHFVLCQPNTEDGKQPIRDKLWRKRREQQAFSPDALSPHRARTDGTGNVKRSLTFTGACSPRLRTSVLSSSAPTNKFRKTQKGPVPNGDVREMSGSAHHSSLPSQSLGKQQRRIEGDRQGQAPVRVQPPAHPVPPPRHRVSSIPSHQEVVHASDLMSSSPASTSDLPWSSDKNSVSSFQPSPAGQSPPVSSVSPSAPHALPDTLSPSQPKSQPQTSSQPQPKSQPQISSQSQQKSQPQTSSQPQPKSQPQTSSQPQPKSQLQTSSQPQPKSQPQTSSQPQPKSQPQTSSQPQPKSQPQTSPQPQKKFQTETVTSVQGHKTGIHPQTQHTTPSVHPPPLPSSPPPSSAVTVGLPDPGSAQDAEESLDLVEDSAVSPNFSRQASLEIEEYDLEHNFPDPHRDHGHTDRPSVGLEYCLDQEMESGTRAEDQLDGEHASLVQLVNTLQEQLQTQESQIGFINTEITALEEKEKAYEEKLHIIMEDLLLYENRQHDLELQLNDLEKVEWENVLDGEKKCEVDLTLNIASMKAAIIEHEEKLASTKTRESQLFSELKEEEEKVSQEKERLNIEEARVREEEEKMKEEISKLQTVLAEEQVKTTECEASLSSIDVELKSVEKDLTEKEAALTETEAKLKDENLKDLLAHPPPKEDPKSGETVLKILEGRLSPRPPTSPSSKAPFIASLTSSSQSGVWV